MPQTYSAAQVVGKNLVAARPVDLKRSADQKAPTIYTAQAGQTVGTVFSWVGGGEKGPLWWQFLDANKRPYYAMHQPGAFSLDVLQAQGALTIQEEKAVEDAKKKDAEGWPNPLGDAAGSLASIAKNILVIGGVVVAGALLLNATRR